MRDLSITDKEKKEASVHSVLEDTPKYPYGLKLHIDEETFEKLGLADAPTTGDKFMILAVAEVSDIRQERYRGDEKKHSMGLQIMQMEVKPHKDKKDAASTIYGGE